MIMRLTLFLLCFVGVLHAQESRPRHLWATSVAAMLAGTAADSYTSWHKHESNSFLASPNGTFGARGVELKVGIAAAVLVPQLIFRRRREWQLPFAISNFAEAGIYTGAAVHNQSVK